MAAKATLPLSRLAQMPWQRVRLVLLAACDSALAETPAQGREFSGLAGVLRQAGVGSVLASLWPIADAPTASFSCSSRSSVSSRIRRKRIQVNSGTYCSALATLPRRMMSQMLLNAVCLDSSGLGAAKLMVCRGSVITGLEYSQEPNLIRSANTSEELVWLQVASVAAGNE